MSQVWYHGEQQSIYKNEKVWVYGRNLLQAAISKRYYLNEVINIYCLNSLDDNQEGI